METLLHVPVADHEVAHHLRRMQWALDASPDDADASRAFLTDIYDRAYVDTWDALQDDAATSLNVAVDRILEKQGVSGLTDSSISAAFAAFQVDDIMDTVRLDQDVYASS